MTTPPTRSTAQRIAEELMFLVRAGKQPDGTPYVDVPIAKVITMVNQELAREREQVREALRQADEALTKIRNAPGNTLNPPELSQMAHEAHLLVRTALAQLEAP